MRGASATAEAIDAERQARIDLAAAHRMAVMHGLNEGICNHFTLMLPGSVDRFLLIPYGTHWAEVTASHFMEVDFAGTIHAGSGIAEQTAFCIHAPLHRARPDARSVLHTHMPFASALARLEDPRLEMIGQTEAGLANAIACDPDYDGLADDPSEGERLAAALGPERTILLMANHGVIVVGRSLAQAYDQLYYLERACQVQLYALWTGRKLKRIAEPVLQKTFRQFAASKAIGGNAPAPCELHFASLKRLLDRREPDYAN